MKRIQLFLKIMLVLYENWLWSNLIILHCFNLFIKALFLNSGLISFLVSTIYLDLYYAEDGENFFFFKLIKT